MLIVLSFDRMIGDDGVAKNALALLENANGLLTKSLTLVREKSTPDEYSEFRGAMAQVLGRLFYSRDGTDLPRASISCAC